MKAAAKQSRPSRCAQCGELVIKSKAVGFQGKLYHPISCAPKAIEAFALFVRRLTGGAL